MQINEKDILILYTEMQQQAAEYLAQGHYSEAVAIYENCIDVNPTAIPNYWYLGLALLLQGEESQAQAVWLSAIVQAKPDEVDAWIAEFIKVLEVQALRQLQFGNLQEAEKIYWQILEQEPNYAEAYKNLGIILFYQDKLDEAVACLRKAIETKPDFADAYNSLGFILQKQSKLEESVVYLRKAIETKPDFAEAHKNLSFVFEIINGQQAGYSPRLGQGYRTWDPWLFKDGDIYHLFYLSGDEKVIPFWSVGEVGAAISTDMKNWDYIGIVLQPHPEREWESGRILAGNVYKENNIYYLFYSATPLKPLRLKEEIGLATSVDGLQWERRSSSLLKPDARFYGSSINFSTQEEHFQWRDPYIVKEPDTGKYYMFMTAAAKEGSPQFRGCIGLAVADKIDGPYEVLPPAAYPLVAGTKDSIYYEMERPQVIYKNGKYYMFFSAWVHWINPKWLEQVGGDKITDSSLYCYVSDKITGPFNPLIEKPVVKGSENTGLYGINFISGTKNELIAYGWYIRSYTLEVSPCFQVRWEADYIEIILN